MCCYHLRQEFKSPFYLCCLIIDSMENLGQQFSNLPYPQHLQESSRVQHAAPHSLSFSLTALLRGQEPAFLISLQVIDTKDQGTVSREPQL